MVPIITLLLIRSKRLNDILARSLSSMLTHHGLLKLHQLLYHLNIALSTQFI